MACKHGLGKRFCAICNKVVRAILQPAPIQHRQHNPATKPVKPNKVTFIDGSPYVNCGNCGLLTKQFDGDHYHKGFRDKVQKLDIQRKIMVGRIDVSYEFSEHSQAYEAVHSINIKSVPGCVSCWQILEDRRSAEPNKAAYFKK